MAALLAGSAHGAECVRSGSVPSPGWVRSVAWVERPAGWIVTDVSRTSLLKLDPRGGSIAEVVRPGLGGDDFTRPSKVVPAGDGSYVVRVDHGRFVWLDGDLRPLRWIDLAADTEEAAGGTLHSVFEWTLGADGALWALAMIEDGERGWWSGLVRIVPRPTPAIERLVELTPGTPEWDLSSMSMALVAALGGRGYFLRYTENPHLLEVSPGAPPRRLRAFPPEFERRPALPRLTSGSVGTFLAASARARLPAGVLAWENRLYLVGHTPDGPGAVRWTVTEIDPEKDRVVRTVVLPTRAADLAVAAGSQGWALLEKGGLAEPLRQEIGDLVLVPAAWLRGAEPAGTACRPARESLP